MVDSSTDCELIPTFPDLTFVLGGKNYTLSSAEYILKMGKKCVSGIQGMDLNLPGGDIWIIGESARFLEKYID
jgi:saccharopepsin